MFVNDMKIPGLFFTWRQALEEGIGIFGASRCLTFDISTERLPRSSDSWDHHFRWKEYSPASETAPGSTNHVLNPETKAVLQVSGDSLSSKSLSVIVCLASYQRHTSHQIHRLVYFHIKCNETGSLSHGMVWGIAKQIWHGKELEEAIRRLVTRCWRYWRYAQRKEHSIVSNIRT